MNLLFSAWMDQLLGGPTPPETEATCLDCPLCTKDPARNPSEHVFNPNTKCCTYMPDLPNFLVGGVYLDQTPESSAGRALFEAKVQRGMIVSPLGIFPDPGFAERYRKNIQQFGTGIELLCPYYLNERGGLCGIWQHRNARCGTWFCKYVRGSVGVIFWKYVDVLFTSVEKLLSRWCVMQLDIGEDALRRLFPPPPSERMLVDLPLMWGRWRGHEREFFEACAHLVEGLSWKQVSAICGIEVQTAAKLTHRAYQDLISTELPRALKKGNWKNQSRINDETIRIWSYNRYDPIDVPVAVLEALSQFDGRPVTEVRALLAGKRITLEDSLLRKFTDFGLLVECEEAKPKE